MVVVMKLQAAEGCYQPCNLLLPPQAMLKSEIPGGWFGGRQRLKIPAETRCNQGPHLPPGLRRRAFGSTKRSSGLAASGGRPREPGTERTEPGGEQSCRHPHLQDDRQHCNKSLYPAAQGAPSRAASSRIRAWSRVRPQPSGPRAVSIRGRARRGPGEWSGAGGIGAWFRMAAAPQEPPGRGNRRFRADRQAEPGDARLAAQAGRDPASVIQGTPVWLERRSLPGAQPRCPSALLAGLELELDSVEAQSGGPQVPPRDIGGCGCLSAQAVVLQPARLPRGAAGFRTRRGMRGARSGDVISGFFICKMGTFMPIGLDRVGEATKHSP
ncbi:PREDICTED: uncharacterized protein LOC105591652 [Cercocebus atys]|uniref:uncharacterized protein LOC105591652 n=1 Tax=Cercocebus atys TaxID=9531 RepID=UPI0005F40D59|nr:PREDICTED: uncharacterized protein LOC105591652 [Cercocebus atys]